MSARFSEFRKDFGCEVMNCLNAIFDRAHAFLEPGHIVLSRVHRVHVDFEIADVRNQQRCRRERYRSNPKPVADSDHGESTMMSSASKFEAVPERLPARSHRSDVESPGWSPHRVQKTSDPALQRPIC